MGDEAFEREFHERLAVWAEGVGKQADAYEAARRKSKQDAARAAQREVAAPEGDAGGARA